MNCKYATQKCLDDLSMKKYSQNVKGEKNVK